MRVCSCAHAHRSGWAVLPAPPCTLLPYPPPHPTPLLTPTLQVAGAVSSLFILIIIVKLGELFQDLPKVSRLLPTARLEGPGQARGSNQSGPR